MDHTAKGIQQASYVRSSMPYLRKILCQDAENADLIRCFSRGSLPTDDMIPANRSISMASLDHFVAEVSEKWRRGDIHNTGGYSTVKCDALIGPMYQVCEHVITPYHTHDCRPFPDVARCELGSERVFESLAGSEVFHFVLHWAEGVFEFRRMLKPWQSWSFPHNFSAAYICFLTHRTWTSKAC